MPSPASAVSLGYVQAQKIVTTFPILSGISASLWNPNFSFFGEVSGILRASLWWANFNFQNARLETRFDVGRDWFDERAPRDGISPSR